MAAARNTSRGVKGRIGATVLQGKTLTRIGGAAEFLCADDNHITALLPAKRLSLEGADRMGKSVDEYVQTLKHIFAETLRVTSPSGSCFFVVGDTYMNKSLQLVPQRLAIAACESGWTLRNDLIWAKSDAAPDGATHRWRFSHEHILFLTKQPRGYKFRADAIRVPY